MNLFKRLQYTYYIMSLESSPEIDFSTCADTLKAYFNTEKRIVIPYDKYFMHGYFLIFEQHSKVKVVYSIGIEETIIYSKTFKNINEAINKIKIIADLEDKTFFCKFTNTLYLTREEFETNNMLNISKAFLVNCLEKCPVCFDYTNHKTECNHILCYVCLLKITEDVYCDECSIDCLKYTCPICRKECHPS